MIPRIFPIKYSQEIFAVVINKLGVVEMQTVLITGVSGFIGYHTSIKFLKAGWRVVGIDCLSDYYDVQLKRDREKILGSFDNFLVIHKRIEKLGVMLELLKANNPDVVVHLAAQAGVRYSIENPRSYLDSNIIGTFELLEACRRYKPKHLLMASTSSAYGANDAMPFHECDVSDHQMSFYAATKKANESFAHSYAHLFDIPITMFRFFTVYGPYGRPDMALFKFTKAIMNDEPIDVYNFGKMKRDFTYVEDLVEGIFRLKDAIPNPLDRNVKNDSLSTVAPWRIVNIGNGEVVELNHFIEAIEKNLGKSANKNFLPMQPGDVPETFANNDLLFDLTGFRPTTNVTKGVKRFVEWYTQYFN